MPNHLKIDEVTTRIDHAIGIPLGLVAALKATTAWGREFILPGIFFPRPDQLDGTRDDLGDGDGLYDLIARVASPR